MSGSWREKNTSEASRKCQTYWYFFFVPTLCPELARSLIPFRTSRKEKYCSLQGYETHRVAYGSCSSTKYDTAVCMRILCFNFFSGLRHRYNMFLEFFSRHFDFFQQYYFPHSNSSIRHPDQSTLLEASATAQHPAPPRLVRLFILFTLFFRFCVRNDILKVVDPCTALRTGTALRALFSSSLEIYTNYTLLCTEGMGTARFCSSGSAAATMVSI